MRTIRKYTNIEQEFPKLPRVLQDAIQHDVLEIKRLDCDCDKYQGACGVYPGLERAAYVVYSPYIKRTEHCYETFVFVDALGGIVCHISGNEMELYGLLKPCTNLALTPEYVNRDIVKEAERYIG